MVHHSKLYRTLSSLSIFERKSVVKFFASPYFNTNTVLVDLLAILEKAIQSDDDTLTKESVWQDLYGSKKYSDVKYRKLFSDGLKILEKWLLQQDFESHPYHTQTHLLNALSDRKLEPLYNVALAQADRIGKQQLEKSSLYHLYNYNKWKNKYNFTTEFSKRKSKGVEDLQTDIENLLLNLDVFYINEKLRYYCTVLSWKKLTKYDTEVLLIDELVTLINDHNLLTIHSIAVYYSIMMSMLEPEKEEHFYRLKRHITDDIDMFSPDEVRDIYDSAVSYCIAKVNSGVYKFTDEVLVLYRQAIDNGALLVNDQLSPTTFRNIVFFACRARQFDWGFDFIERYQAELADKHRESAVNFSLARLHFYREEYQQTVYFLNQVDYEDQGYQLNTRAILISAYYELQEFDALESLLNTFKVFLTRAKYIPEKRKRNYLNLVKYTGQLLRIFPHDKAKLLQLRDKITEDTLVSKPWLLEKIDALAGSRKKAPSSR